MPRAEDLVELIDRVRALVSQGWSSGCLARDKSNRPVHELSSDAVSWCLVGAFNRAAWDIEREEEAANKLRVDLQNALGLVNMTRFNDRPGRSKDEVLDWLDKVRSTIIGRNKG